MAALIEHNTRPPCDSKAERNALLQLCLEPSLIGDVQLASLLNFWEHRVIWEAMVRVHMRRPGLPANAFMVALRRDLHSVECAKAATLMIDRPHEAGVPGCEGQRFLSVLMGTPFDSLGKPITYWVARLVRIQASRRLLGQAQDIATAAWRGDVDEARRVVREMFLESAPRRVADAVVEV